jgi:DNA-binding CsgD family transcriptional regulator
MGLVGRDGEMRRVLGAIAAGRSCAVVGPIGAGVSSVVRETLRAHAAATGVRSWAVDADDVTTLFGTSAVDLLTAIERTGAGLVAIDDVQRLDEAGAAALRFVVQNAGVPFLLGAHPAGTAGARALDQLADRGTVERLRLEPFDAESAAALCRSLDSSMRRVIALDVRRRCGGWPGLMVDVIGDPGALARRLTRAMESEPTDLEAFAWIALAGPTLDATAAVPADAVERLAGAALVRSEASGWSVTVPVLGAVSLGELPVAVRGQIAQEVLDHAELGGHDPGPTARVAWLRAAGRRPNTIDVCDAAVAARRAGRMWDAADLLASVDPAELHTEATMLRAEVAQESGDAALAHDLYRSVSLDPDAALELRARCTVEWGNLLFWDLDQADDALAVIGVLVEAARGTDGEASVIGLLASLQVFGARFREASLTLEPLLAHHDGAITLLAAASLHAVCGDGRRAVDLARRALAAHEAQLTEETGVAGLELYVNGGVLALGEAGRIVEAVELARRGDDGRFERDSRQGWSALALSRALLLAGDLRAAGAAAAVSVESFTEVGRTATLRWALAARALAAAEMGDVATARVAADRLLAMPPVAAVFLDTDVERAIAFVEAAEGRHSEARDRLRMAAQRADGMGAHALAAMAWHDLVRLGGAKAAAGPLRRNAGKVTSDWTPWRVLHAESVLADDITGLERAALGFRSLGAVLHALEAASHALGLARSSSDRDAMTRLVPLVAELREACPDAATPLVRSAVAADLTPREREVAEMAAAGRANREIAELLFVSQRTVENLLQRVYGKLGLGGRDQLGDALRGA